MITRFAAYWGAAVACAFILSAAAPAGATPALDTAFSGGVVTPKVFPEGKQRQVARGTALQPDGKVVVAMGLATGYGRRAQRPVMRFNKDGTPDQSFGTNGTAWFGLKGAKRMGLVGVAIQPDGKLLVSGARYAHMKGDGEWFIARLNPDGQLDTTYGASGERRIANSYHGGDRSFVSLLVLVDMIGWLGPQRYGCRQCGRRFRLGVLFAPEAALFM